MSTNLVVIGTDLRRASVKIPSNGYMIDVLEDACTKLKLSPETYQLKYKNKAINLTDPIRAAGLPPGAKLELVVKSRTPSAVTVALRLPPSEAALGIPQNRVSSKVRSDTPLWKLLRHLEESEIAKQKGLNLSARGVPRMTEGGGPAGPGGSGQLYWEVPVLKFAGRELVTFDDYRKTLSQVGIDTGSQLIMLEFRISDYTLQEAMELVQTQLEGGGSEATTTQPTQKSAASDLPEPAAAPAAPAPPAEPRQPAADPMQVDDAVPAQPEPTQPTQPEPEQTRSAPQPADTAARTTFSLKPVQVWSPPKAGMPAATSLRWAKDEASTFAPSIAQMKAHQKHLEEAGRNRRLKSDQELDEEAREREAKAAAVSKVDVRVRFPDGYTVMWSLAGNGPDAATGATLHAAVRSVLADAIQDKPFRLAPPMFRPHEEILDKADPVKHGLVRGYGMRGGVVVNFMRGPNVAALPAGQPYLRPEVTGLAEDITIPQVAEVDDDDDDDDEEQKRRAEAAAKESKRAASKGDAASKMAKFLRLAKK